jgi:hypothetical protein
MRERIAARACDAAVDSLDSGRQTWAGPNALPAQLPPPRRTCAPREHRGSRPDESSVRRFLDADDLTSSEAPDGTRLADAVGPGCSSSRTACGVEPWPV